MGLKLKQLPDRSTRKLILRLSPELYDDLTAYSDAYKSEYGNEERISDIAVAIIDTFLGSDTQFRKSRRSQSPSSNTNQPEKE